MRDDNTADVLLCMFDLSAVLKELREQGIIIDVRSAKPTIIYGMRTWKDENVVTAIINARGILAEKG